MAVLGPVSGKDVVEGVVLADQYDQVFDRRVCLHVIILISPIIGGSQTASHHGTKYSTHGRSALPAISNQNS
jgi:hypothetical protein